MKSALLKSLNSVSGSCGLMTSSSSPRTDKFEFIGKKSSKLNRLCKLCLLVGNLSCILEGSIEGALEVEVTIGLFGGVSDIATRLPLRCCLVVD